MSNTRQRNKGNSAESSSQAAASDGAKKSQKSNKGASPPPAGASSGVFRKLVTFLFYACLIAGSACTGWFVYNLLEEVSQINGKLNHLSEQKGELAATVHSLQEQVPLLQKTVGRLEFISKDIQEKQLLQDSSIKKSEKELDQVGVILKKLQKDLSNVMQDVTDQGDRDLIQFEKSMSEKFTELNNSINDDITEITKVQKSSQSEINNVKAKLASLGELDSVKGELRLLNDITSQLKTSLDSKQASIEWLMNNALSVETITSNSQEIAQLRYEHDDLKKAVDAQVAAVEDLKGKVNTGERSNVEALVKEFEQISSSVAEMENNYVSANNDLLKEIESNRDTIELRLTPLENIVATLTAEKKVSDLRPVLEDFAKRLSAVEEAYTGLKMLTSVGDAEAPEALLGLQEGQQALSKHVDELKSAVAELPKIASELETLQVEITSVLEEHGNEIEMLKEEYNRLQSYTAQNKVGSLEGDKPVTDAALQVSVGKLETDLKMLRTAVDSLVAYSVKIETNEKELHSTKESLEDLRQSTDKLMVKLEQIQEEV
ncbi:cytoskeleton-associated protein 4 [Pelodytes ibericus]